MIKRKRILIVAVALLFSLLAACSTNNVPSQNGINTYESYIDSAKRIATQAGDVYGDVARDLFKAGEVLEYGTVPDMLEALRSNKVDAVLLSHGYVKQLQDSGAYPEFEYLWIPKEVYVNEAAPIFHTEALKFAYNEWFASICEDGTWQEIVDRWIGAPLPDQADIPAFELSGENGTLKLCDTGSYPPLSYFDENGKPAGFDVEMMSLFAQHMGMDIEWTIMSYDAIVPYVASGKADMSGCTLTVTEERNDGLIFREPSVITQAVLVVPKGRPAQTTKRDYTCFEGKDIGVLTSSFFDTVVENKLNATPKYYDDDAASLEDVRQGRIYGAMYDLSVARVMHSQPGNDVFELIEIPSSLYSGAMGAISADQNVIDRFNEFLATIEADGTLAEMQHRWIDNDPTADPPMPNIPTTGENGTITFACSGVMMPFSYMGSNDELKGFCIELGMRFAAYEGKAAIFKTVAMNGMISYVNAGKADMAVEPLAITPERQESTLFTNPIYHDCVGVLVLKENELSTEAGVKYTDFYGKRFAVKNGTIYDNMSREEFEASEVMLFEDYTSIYEAVLTGKVDAGMRGYWAAWASMFETQYSDLAVVAIPEELHNNPIGAISINQELIDKFNSFLADIKESGIYDEMYNRWFDTFNPKDMPEMPELENSGANGTLVVAISSDYMPFSFLGEDGINLGFDIEMAHRFAASLNKDIEFIDMAFSGLVPYIKSGKADIGISDISITEERKQSVMFTDPYFIDLSSIVYKKSFVQDNEVKTEDGIIAWIKNGIERNLITDNRWKMIVDGLAVTMIIATLAQVFGTAFACVVCWLLMRKNKFLRSIGNLYCRLIYGTPIVVLLMITYYIIFGNTSISNVFVAIVAFSMTTGASIATSLKGAIDTIDPVEIEAARSIGFSSIKAFGTITLPQAIKRALPGYTNGFVELVKATAIVGYIAIQDLTRAGNIILSRTYDPYFPLLVVALIYLIVTTICVQVFKLIIKKANKGGLS